MTNIHTCCTTEQISIPIMLDKFTRPYWIHRLMLKIMFLQFKRSEKNVGMEAQGAHSPPCFSMFPQRPYATS